MLCRNGRQHTIWLTMINNSNSTHPWKCPHHSLGFHPLAVDHEKQKHEEHHEVEDQNEHRQPGRLEEKRVERGPKKEKEIPPEVAFSWPLSRSHALSLGKLKSDCQLCAHSFITSSVTVPFPLISAELLNNNTKLLSFSRKLFKSPALTVKSFQTCNPVLLARRYFDQVLTNETSLQLTSVLIDKQTDARGPAINFHWKLSTTGYVTTYSSSFTLFLGGNLKSTSSRHISSHMASW